jgi:hypothetical protein
VSSGVDYPLGETIDFLFTTRRFSTGAPDTLSAATIAVYEDGTATPIQTSIAVTEDFNSIVGLNAFQIAATSGNGYDSGSSYHLVIEAGTVDSVSVVGEVVGNFTIERGAALMPTTAGRTLDVAATGEAGVDLGNVTGTLTQANVGWVDANSRVDVGSWLGTAVAALVTGTADSGDTTSMVDAARTEADTDYWEGCWIRFTSGNISGQVRAMTAFTPGTDTIAFEPAVTQAVSTQDYEILPAGATGIDWDQQVSGTHTVQTADHTAAIATAQADLDTLTGTDGATLATSQPNYAPSVAGDAMDLVANAVDATAIATDAITAAKIATDAIGAAELATDAIGDAQIATGAIASTAFAAGAIDAAAIATDAITSAELADSAAQKVRDEVLPTQNAAFTFHYLWVDSTDHVTPVTGAGTMSVTRSIDGAAFGAGGGTITEIANGMYEYAASAADMNGAVITFRFVATSGTPNAPDDAFITVVTTGGV